MAHEDDDWGLGSGFALDGATGIVTNAEFGFNASMGAGITCLNLTITNDDDGEEMEQSFSCGNKFESSKDGSELIGAGKIIRTSNYGILLESVREQLVAAGHNGWDAIGLDPRIAATWVGIHATWGTIERETRNPTTNVTKMSTSFIITELLDREGEAAKPAAKKAGGATKKAAASKAAPAADPTAAPEGVEDDLWTELLALADQHEDHGDFATAALELDAVDGNRAAQKAIMGTKAGSVWAAKAAAA